MPREQPQWLRDLTWKLKQKQAGLPVPDLLTPFTLVDFRRQLERIAAPATAEMLKSIPGLQALMTNEARLQQLKDLGRIVAMIDAMTLCERLEPSRIDSSRRQRIARGSGVSEADVDKLIHDFQAMQRLMAALPFSTQFESDF
jgi:signal recognition particle GTPase